MKYVSCILIAIMVTMSLNSCDGSHMRHHAHSKHIAIHKPLKAHVPIPQKRKTVELLPYHDNVYMHQKEKTWEYVEIVDNVIDALGDVSDYAKITKVENTYFGPNPTLYNNVGACARGVRFALVKDNEEIMEEAEVTMPGIIEAEDEKAQKEAEQENEAIDEQNAETDVANAEADALAEAANVADAASDAAADASDSTSDAGSGDSGGDSGGDGD